MPKPLAAFGAVVVSFGHLPTRTHFILLLLAPAAACAPDPSTPVHTPPQIADSAGGGNGIRSHVLIGVQGVP